MKYHMHGVVVAALWIATGFLVAIELAMGRAI
jgi:hypothetical protein